MKRYSRTGAALATATLGLATVFLVAGGSAGQAKPQKAERSPQAAFTAMQSGGKPAEALDAATTAAIGKDEDGVPSFTDAEVWVNSGLNHATTWETDITGLHPDTDYHIIVQAADAASAGDQQVADRRPDRGHAYDDVEDWS